MIEFVSTLILAIVQGITEWFPVSSSSHLIILSRFLGFNNTLAFDVALHFGTLMAVFIYFGKDIVEILRDVLTGKFKTENGKMGMYLIIASIPAALIGYLMRDFIGRSINNMSLIALGLGITGLLLLIGSLKFNWSNKVKLNYKTSILIGVVQAFAIFRGISRTGSTVSAGLVLGLNEKTAVKFSFLSSIPVVFGANIFAIGNNTIPSNYIWASFVAFIVGLAMINVSYKYVLSNRKNLRWFAAYVLLLAAGIGVWLLVS